VIGTSLSCSSLKPLKRLFNQLVARRGDNYFDWYRNYTAVSMTRFGAEFDLVGRLRLCPSTR
jgi:hypothetical protein